MESNKKVSIRDQNGHQISIQNLLERVRQLTPEITLIVYLEDHKQYQAVRRQLIEGLRERMRVSVLKQ